jgi:heme/copper-type cytochrome/quinol oxidase subunit 2
MISSLYHIVLYLVVLAGVFVTAYRIRQIIGGPRPALARALNEIIWTAIPVAIIGLLLCHAQSW